MKERVIRLLSGNICESAKESEQNMPDSMNPCDWEIACEESNDRLRENIIDFLNVDDRVK